MAARRLHWPGSWPWPLPAVLAWLLAWLLFKLLAAQGVHAGIRAAGAGHRHTLAGKLFDRRFQRTLHGRAIVLALPADKRRSVIFQGQAITHQKNRVPAGSGKPFSS